MRTATSVGIAIALLTSTSALAQTAKYDETIAKAAAAKAAEKIGEIRGSIDYDANPFIVKKEDLAEKTVNTSFSPSAAKTTDDALPPMTSNQTGIDLTTTGSITKPAPKLNPIIMWEKFDRYGNPIK